MSAVGRKLRSGEAGKLMFWCPGCDGAHAVGVGEGPGPRWTYNGDAEAPTFSPSVLVTGSRPLEDSEIARVAAGEAVTPVPTVCHFFVRGGSIQFLADCTHDLAGQTVPLPDFEVKGR